MPENIDDKKSSALTAATTTITNTAGSGDFAWADVTTTNPFGLADQAEARSSFEAIRVNQLRIAQIETALKLAGILT